MPSTEFDGLPLTRRYIESVPEGLDSYPECVIKGSACRAILDTPPERLDIEAIPPTLRDLLDNPPVVSAWVPEVRVIALVHAVRELAFDSDAEFLAWSERGFMTYFGGSLYRILLAVASPQRLARGADKKWTALRRGTSRTLVEVHDDHNIGVIECPAGLFDPLYVELLCKGVLAAYRLSRARNPRAEVLDWTPTQSTVRVIYDQDSFVPA